MQRVTVQFIGGIMFYGIGVGVGSSGAVTKKAIDVLGKLDILYVPTAKRDEKFSTAHKIVIDYVKDGTIIKDRHFPMNYDSEELQKAWSGIAAEIEADVKEGKQVGFVTIGDPMVYSTYIYLLRLLRDKIEISTIPGIASFLDIASNHNFPLVEGEDSLVIVPATAGGTKIRQYLQNENSIVLMKVYRNFEEVVSILSEEGLLGCSIAVSNSSKDDETVYRNIEAMKKEDVSYFTTILINKRWVV